MSSTPCAALALILILKPLPAVGIGLAIMMACPPAPLMVRAAPQTGGGSAEFIASLHLSLATLAFLTVPGTLYVLSIPLGFHTDVDLGAMAAILGKTILIPIGLGFITRACFPAFAGKVGPLLGRAGIIGVVIALLVLLAAFHATLLDMDGWSYLVITAVSAAALTIGHVFGPRDRREKTVLAVECGVRHPALALTIAATNFRAERAMPVLFPCLITFLAVATLYLVWRRKTLSRAD